MLQLDKDDCVASPSTYYRVLRKHNLVHHRGNSRPPQKKALPPERVATGPNQVWAWDITYLKTDVKGIYFYLYSVIDVWSRKLVGWTISDRESADVSKLLFNHLITPLKIQTPLYLHSDNGNAMKAETLLTTLHRLGVIPSRSRPRVSDDNAFIESFFKTPNYAPSYPGYFKSIEQAQTWVDAFVTWYNTKHLHSGIGYVTPEQKHSLLADQIIAHRNAVKQKAYEAHPNRWSRPLGILKTPQVVYLNPSKETREKLASGT
jgi:transposase InsO family protein